MILITGCAGFIGFHLAQKLLIQKKKVIGIDNIDKAKKMINWNPKTNLKSSIKKFVDWYKINNV